MSESVIRYAVVGLGRAGWGIHVHQLRGRADAKITAVVDPVKERRDEAVAEFGCAAYTSLSRGTSTVSISSAPSRSHVRRDGQLSGLHVIHSP